MDAFHETRREGPAGLGKRPIVQALTNLVNFGSGGVPVGRGRTGRSSPNRPDVDLEGI